MDMIFSCRYGHPEFMCLEVPKGLLKEDVGDVAAWMLEKLRLKVDSTARFVYSFEGPKKRGNDWLPLTERYLVTVLEHARILSRNSCYIFFDQEPKNRFWLLYSYGPTSSSPQLTPPPLVGCRAEYKKLIEGFDFSAFLEVLLNKQEITKDQAKKALQAEFLAQRKDSEPDLFNGISADLDNKVEKGLSIRRKTPVLSPAESERRQSCWQEMIHDMQARYVRESEVLRQMEDMGKRRTPTTVPTPVEEADFPRSDNFYDDVVESVMRYESDLTVRRVDKQLEQVALTLTEAESTSIRGKEASVAQQMEDDEQMVNELVKRVMSLKSSRSRNILRTALRQIKAKRRSEKDRRREAKRENKETNLVNLLAKMTLGEAPAEEEPTRPCCGCPTVDPLRRKKNPRKEKRECVRRKQKIVFDEEEALARYHRSLAYRIGSYPRPADVPVPAPKPEKPVEPPRSNFGNYNAPSQNVPADQKPPRIILVAESKTNTCIQGQGSQCSTKSFKFYNPGNTKLDNIDFKIVQGSSQTFFNSRSFNIEPKGYKDVSIVVMTWGQHDPKRFVLAQLVHKGQPVSSAIVIDFEQQGPPTPPQNYQRPIETIVISDDEEEVKEKRDSQKDCTAVAPEDDEEDEENVEEDNENAEEEEEEEEEAEEKVEEEEEEEDVQEDNESICSTLPPEDEEERNKLEEDNESVCTAIAPEEDENVNEDNESVCTAIAPEEDGEENANEDNESVCTAIAPEEEDDENDFVHYEEDNESVYTAETQEGEEDDQSVDEDFEYVDEPQIYDFV
ncbi:unnamed protein product [Caenorhabditis auriculariae]|uniref:Major sperm protein n=1 Tax=Caenorhabditis auriculariae TaxID=2777116 RepID=A0A8S1H9G2_9PELO|nr:unnamed protein product [Caenorhabditis auriculariae]